MKKIILFAIAVLCAAGVIAQTKMRVWSGNGIAYEQNIAQIDSITFAIENTEGALSGEFSVSSTKKVRFSKGNLQFNAALGTHKCADGTTQQGTWRFAENQWEFAGVDNNNASATYSGWIDLFAWGTSGYNDRYPYLKNDVYDNSYFIYDSKDISGTWYDWGVYNEISNGGTCGMWRTLTANEAEYLLFQRNNANNLCVWDAFVNGVQGFILYPDNWSFETSSSYTLEDWIIAANNGAAFMPLAGVRDYSLIGGTGWFYVGYYWTGTYSGERGKAMLIDAYTSSRSVSAHAVSHGRSVRLVQDVDASVTPPTPPVDYTHAFSVGTDKKVQFSKGNLQYQAGTNTWRFAEHQYDAIGSANSNISASYTGWIDLFGWGTGETPTYSMKDNNNYSTFVDWGTNKISNTDNESIPWRTLTADEWKYIFFTRVNALTLFGLGKVNGVSGTIVLPDDWSTPQGISFTPSTSKGLKLEGNDIYGNSNTNNFSHNAYSLEQWKVLEDAGAIFLPVGGLRDGLTINYVGITGDYWSSTAYDSNNACSLGFDSGRLLNHNDTPLYFGRSVRLVRDVK